MASVTPEVLLDHMASGSRPAILDVRTKLEYCRGHVPGAQHIPFQQIAWRAHEIACHPNAPLVVYCGHGPRAWIANRVLRARGFRNIVYLKGHWRGWARTGLPRER